MIAERRREGRHRGHDERTAAGAAIIASAWSRSQHIHLTVTENHEKQGGVFVAVFFSGNIGRSDREQTREPEQMQVSDSDTQEIRAGASAAVHT